MRFVQVFWLCDHQGLMYCGPGSNVNRLISTIIQSLDFKPESRGYPKNFDETHVLKCMYSDTVETLQLIGAAAADVSRRRLAIGDLQVFGAHKQCKVYTQSALSVALNSPGIYMIQVGSSNCTHPPGSMIF